MSTESADLLAGAVVALARLVIAVLAVGGLALVVMIARDAVAVWPARPRPRHGYTDGPGAQYWVRSPSMVITAEYDVYEGEAS